MFKNGLKTFSKEKLNDILFLPPKELAKKYNMSLASAYNYRYNLKKKGGIDGILKTKNYDLNTESSEKNKEDIQYKEEMDFLKESKLIDNVIFVIKENIPKTLVDDYVTMFCKMLHDKKLLNNIEFFNNIEERIKNIIKDIINTNPIPEKIVEVEKKVEVEKVVEKIKVVKSSVDNPLDSIYTASKIQKEYSKFFLSEKAVNQFIENNKNKIGCHFIEVIPGEFILDEYGVIALMEIIEEVEKYYPADDEIFQKIREQNAVDTANKRVEINESLLDITIASTKNAIRLKALYTNNKLFFDSLNLFRKETSINPHKKSVTKEEYQNYCNDKNRVNEPIYFIEQDENSNIKLHIKHSDFLNLMNKESKIIELWKSKKLLEYDSIKNSYIILYTKLKDVIISKTGVLNGIQHLKM